ncbi:MAG: KOW domain-containing RNA-binding protein, partial [Acetatifactor sp.]|nr:KOW domain-containing RNA-binding protein [Acetatifactor sp.]
MIGCFAISKAGHDKSTLYVIIAEDKDMVYLCDGRNKTMVKPKKKNIKHIQPINQTIDNSLLLKLQQGDKVTD